MDNEVICFMRACTLGMMDELKSKNKINACIILILNVYNIVYLSMLQLC